MVEKNKIGIEVPLPKEKCDDKHCPFHSGLPIRGRTLSGEIAKIGSHKTATVVWERAYYLPKYQRYEKRRSHVAVHIPPCFDVKVGDKVEIVETRPISKTKNFVLVEVISK